MKRIAIRLMLMPESSQTGRSVVVERQLPDDALQDLGSLSVYEAHIKGMLEELAVKATET